MKSRKEELYHYGVPGMHWGVINEKESVPETKSSAIERFRNFEKNFREFDFSKSGLEMAKNDYIAENPIDEDMKEPAKQFAKESRDLALTMIDASYAEATAKKQILDKLKETRSEEEIAQVYDKINEAVSRRSGTISEVIPIFDNRTFAAEYGDEFNEGNAIDKINTISSVYAQIAEEAQRYLEENFEELRGTDWELSVDEAVAINDPSPEKTTVSKEEIQDKIPTSNNVVMDTPISEIKVTKESIKQKISKFIGKAVESAKKAIENGVNFIKKLFGRG